MGTLTEAMTHLRGEIESMRGARFAMMGQMVVDARDRSVAVAEMRHGFARAHSQMARSARAFRSSFMAELRRKVASQRRDFGFQRIGNLRRRRQRAKGISSVRNSGEHRHLSTCVRKLRHSHSKGRPAGDR